MRYLFIFILVIVITSCDEEVQQGPNFIDSNPNDTEIQVDNKSYFELDSFYINTSGGDQLYGQVDRRNTTQLRAFRYAYPEMEIRFQVDAKQFIHLPVDYSSMSKVESGQYELEINGVDTNKLSFTFLLKKI